MDQTLLQCRPQIEELCTRYCVQSLEVFGSAVGKGFDADRSDIDFLVDFKQLGEGEHADAYFGLLEELQSLLNRPIDLVMVRAIRNPYFLQAIEKSRTPLYAA